VGRLALFIGKGGVGKTTISSAYAMRLAALHPRQSVLLLSTDPAHSLADLFQQPFSSDIERVSGRGRRLYVWQLDAERYFRAFVAERRAEILAILVSGSIFSKEEIEPFLDATLPGMAEMAALLAIQEATTSSRYGYVIVDTAPFGHTLRLFEMPESFQRFLSFLEFVGSRDQVLAAHFGGKATQVGEQLVHDWKRMGRELLTLFRQHADIFLVTTPEKFALNESLRCREVLHNLSSPLAIKSIVLNRAVLRKSACKFCRARVQATKSARALLQKQFARTKLYVAEDSGAPVLGLDGLRQFAAHVFSRKPLASRSAVPQTKSVKLVRAKWPVLTTPLTLVLGKGGVGKTTISAALGFHTRTQTSRTIDICSVDPAPSLDDVFQTEVGDHPRPVLSDPKFRASEMDSMATFRNWASRIKDLIDSYTAADSSQIHVDLWFERNLFEQLLESVPPGVDEILAVFRILDLLTEPRKRVLIDMAPTGHALELLKTPDRILVWTRLLLKTLAAHRRLAVAQDAGVQVAELGHRVRSLAKMLADSKAARVYTVMLAEFLPDRETERLLNELQTLNLSLGPIFVNRLLFAEDVRHCARCSRARSWQLSTLSGLRNRFRNMQIFVARNFPAEIAGKRGLRSFTSELWQLP
jgi:arsenite/tail-anchored protein-transporting ATPase